MKILKIALSALLFLGVCFLIFLSPKLIKIRFFRCKSQFGECNQEIVRNLESLNGENLTSFKRGSEKILSESSLVKEYCLQFKLPPSYDVNVIERVARYAMTKDGEDWRALVNGDGEVIQIVDQTSLPTVSVAGDLPSVGGRVDEKILFALKTIYDLYLSYQVDYGVIDDDHLLIELNRDIKVLFPLEGDRQVLIGSLNLILNRLNENAEGFKIEDVGLGGKTIDLRYKNPIIR